MSFIMGDHAGECSGRICFFVDFLWLSTYQAFVPKQSFEHECSRILRVAGKFLSSVYLIFNLAVMRSMSLFLIRQYLGLYRNDWTLDQSCGLHQLQ
jgi:hypothetical protein